MPSSRAIGAYKQQATDPVDVRVNAHAPLVKKLAYHMVARLPASVEVDDLIQAGLIGLMEAARNFDPDAGVQFETFATQRIRGAMLDELRETDWLPRQLRRSARDIEAALVKLGHSLGHAPNEGEVATEMGLSLNAYQELLADCRGHQLVYYDDYDNEEEGRNALDNMAADQEADPLRELDDSDFRRVLIDGIANLPEREKMVMALYYEQELNLKEIGAVLNVTESRVSQLHSQAVARLRVRLRDWTEK
ncbi:RNA polymerase sigma factor FliA [Chitinimonas sp. BJB300]|uniref:RNA polymerase sigma factor FliA n=1 Tax=Chitinimonas sp. BJB300 TaxID=1559339 RepID=UPI000C0F2B84|nr:RNA polymerase sigma factor FliA [Chitinimonas sp. BJB300]PHV11552.1 RNA polymerase sigma factor FliA [Chitinimonas sp. BJB300]TSJ87260.1 RNA polymerase sigma factor FliA [Chitinimonas sp. BJB300]